MECYWSFFFYQFIKDIFKCDCIPRKINKTLLVFIPKNNNSTTLKMYRPISMCIVAYKTITKIIANRLKSFLPQLIYPQQTSFVPSRHIIENIVVAQEVIHSIKKSSGMRGCMAIKLDLKKPYDRLN